MASTRRIHMRAWLLALLSAACAVPPEAASNGEGSARVTIVVNAPEATEGEVVVEEAVDPEDVLRSPPRVSVGPLRIGETIEVELPAGWLTLVATGELSPHPGCDDVEGEQPRYEEGWSARHEVWVGEVAPPTGRPVEVVPGGRVERITFELVPTCGCCLD